MTVRLSGCFCVYLHMAGHCVYGVTLCIWRMDFIMLISSDMGYEVGMKNHKSQGSI